MLIHEGFQQAVPKLEGTAWSDDTAFQAIVRRLVPPDAYRKIDKDLTALQNRIAGRESISWLLSMHSLISANQGELHNMLECTYCARDRLDVLTFF